MQPEKRDVTALRLRSLSLDAANLIKYDLTGRAGFDQWWDSIDPDIQDDIEQAWVELIAATFQGAIKDA